MRVNIYAEEITDRIEIITKEIDGVQFMGIRFYLELPVSTYKYAVGQPVKIDVTPQTHKDEVLQIRGPFIHHPGDDDSSAVTFWGKSDFRHILRKALSSLDNYYQEKAENRRG